MTPESFVTLLILAWLGLAGVTLWAFLRVPRRRARLQRKARRAHTLAAERPAQALPQRS
ncbi:hypothetical protein PZU19_14420 [Pseudomonas aeruginosa]|nr:hypothetical protein [Pseudomonas aeruginosa]